MYDAILCIDSADSQAMLGKFFDGRESYFYTQQLINIDHHASNTKYGDIHIIDAQASSVCELLTEIIEEHYPNQITPEIATYLFM
jgi:phosphoesterase RecJ-like protein